jgi:hypothetical protein
VIDGRCQGWLPTGNVIVEVARGFEYEPLRTVVQIDAHQHSLELRIRRFADLFKQGWVSGDTHVHFLSVDGAHLEAAAEDVHVVNLLQLQLGSLYTNTEDFTGQGSVSHDGATIVWVGQENRHYLLGHIGLLGLRAPVMPWSTDGPSAGEIGGSLETTLSYWADEAHAQGALVTMAHFAYPNGETAALVATGRLDAAEFAWLGSYSHGEYYRYLNAGYRLPLVGGTDKMSAEVPVGLCRTYVRLEADEPFSYEAWVRNIRRGRTFVTTGPIIHLAVEGAIPGDTLRLATDGGSIHVEASVESAIPIQSLQIVAGGHVVAEAKASNGGRRLEINESLSIAGNTWIAARAGGPVYFDARQHLDYFARGAFAHTSPIYVACGPSDWSMNDEGTLDYMLNMVEAARLYVRDMSPRTRLAGGGHPHAEGDHLAYLERPFIEAQQRLLLRQRLLG